MAAGSGNEKQALAASTAVVRSVKLVDTCLDYSARTKGGTSKLGFFPASLSSRINSSDAAETAGGLRLSSTRERDDTECSSFCRVSLLQELTQRGSIVVRGKDGIKWMLVCGK